mmetsp:Transcript_45847/g.127200  ORF Transcript_45847/g.127200 Transcript_45847/m.127200 type:complete len:213 (-) Transcript_45847:157-795(-)
MAGVAVTVIKRRNAAGNRPDIGKVNVADIRRMQCEMEADIKRDKFRRLLRKYDTNQSGKLNKEQMLKLLTDLDTSTPPGTPPTGEELDFIISGADVSGSWFGFSDGEIDATEIEHAVASWNTYTKMRADLDRAFVQYDGNNSGTLEQFELKAYLTDLNGGNPVTDEETAWVFKMADLNQTGDLSKPELMMATLEWYSYVKRGPKKAGCCTIC